VHKADNLPPSSADVTESGSLNLPEPFWPYRSVMGMLYLLVRRLYVTCEYRYSNFEAEAVVYMSYFLRGLMFQVNVVITTGELVGCLRIGTVAELVRALE
jgi:hypothetical protein